MTSPAQRTYAWIDAHIRETAVELVEAILPASPSRWAACKTVAAQLSVHPNSVRNWYEAARAAGPIPVDADLARRVAQLEALNAALVDTLKDRSPR